MEYMCRYVRGKEGEREGKKRKVYRGKEMNFFVENIEFIADHLSLSQ